MPAAHLVAADAPNIETVVGQLRVDAKTNEHKAALELLGVLPLRGRIVTADAMFTRRDVSTVIMGQGRDYILPAKDNQPKLLSNNQAAFAEPLAFPPGRPSGGGRVSTGPVSPTRGTAELRSARWR